MEKPKVLIFIESLRCGGAEKSLVSLLGCIDLQKVDVDLMITTDGDHTDIFMPYVPTEVKVFKMPERKGWRKCIGGVFDAYYSVSWRLLKALKINRHAAETLWQTKGRVAQPLNRHYNYAIAYQQGFPTYYIADCVSADKKIAWINTDLENAGYNENFNRKIYDKYDHIVTVSNQLYEALANSKYFNAQKLTTVYDILNVNLIRKMAQENLTDQESGRDCLKLVTVGRLSTHKNYPLAVAAAAILKQRGIDFKWTFVGEGVERAVIEKAIADNDLGDNVILAGLQPNPYPFIKDADIYVHTASFEGFGLTIAEAKILGKPIVSTNFRIVYDQITDGENGLIAQMNPESVADKIIMMYKDKTLRDRIVAAINREENNTYITEVSKLYQLLGL